MAWAPLALAATATAISVVGAVRGGNAQAASDNYQAQVAQNNAKIAEQNATYATEAGGIKAGDIQQRGRVQQGRIKAAQAASGIDVNSGSAPMVRAGQAQMTQVDAQRAEHEAALNAYGYRSQASGYQAQAQLDRMGAKNAQTAGYFAAGGSLLSGASSLAGKWGSTSGAGPGGSSIFDTSFDSEADHSAGNFVPLG